MNRDDFPILSQDVVFLDNGATTLKPKVVVDKMNDYYFHHTSNIHRGEYDFSIQTNQEYDDVRKKISQLVHCSEEEVVFTSGATMSLNLVVFGYMRKFLKKGDVVLLNKAEHASNILPWIKLSEEIGIILRYVPLEEDYSLSFDTIKKYYDESVKVISLAHVTNVIGDVRDVSSIGKFCHDHHVLFVVDGSQSVPHMREDFIASHMDFLCFSGHKMCGPTGVGVLVGKKNLLENMDPLLYGGGMNSFFEEDNTYELKKSPTKFEGGTPAIAEVIGLGRAVDYLMEIGLANIEKHEKELKKYFLSKVKDIPNLILYNKNSDSGIVSFNIEGVFAQDVAVYLNYYHICVRAGNHCAKLLKDEMNVKNTIRASFYFYNHYQDIDRFVDALRKSKDIFKVVL